MFQTVCKDFVKSVCSPQTPNSSMCVYPCGSINDGSNLRLGTFAIKQQKNHFWQSSSCRLIFPATANIDESKSATTVDLLDDFKKEIQLSESNSFGLTALKQIGISFDVGYEYKLTADLGPIHRLDLNRDSILDYSVPTQIVDKVKKGPRRVLGLVTSVFVVPNSCTITLSKDLSITDKLSAGAIGTTSIGPGDSNILKSDKINTFKMVAGQIIAYSVQECDVDVDANKFSFPFGSDKAVSPSVALGTDAADSNYVMVPPENDIEDAIVEDLKNEMKKLEGSYMDHLLKLVKNALRNSIGQELTSFAFELEENVYSGLESKSVEDFDCENAQLLAVVAFVFKEKNNISVTLNYLLNLFKYAQELPLHVLYDVSGMKNDQIGVAKEPLISTARESSKLNEDSVVVTDTVFESAPEMWKDLFVLEKKPCGHEVEGEKEYCVKKCNLDIHEYHALEKFMQLLFL